MIEAAQKRRARTAVNNAVGDGKLPRVGTQACTDCGAPAREYDHAHGYADVDFLRVEPVCYTCHGRRTAVRGEGARGDANAARRYPERRARGARVGGAKLDAPRVRGIRALRAAGMTLSDLADGYGVHQSLISLIALRRVWRHLP